MRSVEPKHQRQEATLHGKTCVLTGATAGIGKATAVQLARIGASLVLVCRNELKAAAIQKFVTEQVPGAAVRTVIANLAVQSSVRALAQELNQRCARIDLLINNAGVMKQKCSLTPDGIEVTFAVNHLAVFLLTELLLDKIVASAPARIINVGSEGHRAELLSGRPGQIDFGTFQGDADYGSLKAYTQSKLAVLMFSYDLASQLNGTGVTVNCVHPGSIRTALGREFSPLLVQPIHVLSGSGAPEQGAAVLVYLASSSTLIGVSGGYFSETHKVSSSPASYDQAVRRRLWDESSKLTGLRVPYPGVIS